MPDAYVGRLAEQLSLTDTFSKQAALLAASCVANGATSGRQPIGIAAAAIYLLTCGSGGSCGSHGGSSLNTIW